MCGKNFCLKVCIKKVPGSPPRVREKLRSFQTNLNSMGITPACAGKTPNKTPLVVTGQDHPRVCGKNQALRFVASTTPGSPPRVREKPSGETYPSSNDRITPACAGKTPPLPRFQQQDRDHPRVCGKNCNRSTTLSNKSGSPPRVREKLHHSCRLTTWTWDHPRVCGKNWVYFTV